jgi:hypothetical protein
MVKSNKIVGQFANNPNNWFAVEDNDWAYLCNTGGNGSIYRMHKVSSDKLKLSEDVAWFINLSDGWIYYSNISDNGKIYKVRTDGSKRSQLNDQGATYLNLVGDWIYFCNEDEGYTIFKIKKDGNSLLKLNEDMSTFLHVYDGYIYYSNESNDKEIYRVDLEGGNKVAVGNVKSNDFCIANGWIYYSDYSDGFLYKITIKGEEKTLLNKVRSENINICGDWLYYVRTDSNKKLYKIGINGKGNKKLNEIQSWYINVLDTQLYFTSECEYEELYCVDLNNITCNKVFFEEALPDYGQMKTFEDSRVNGAGNSNNYSIATYKDGWVYYNGRVGEELHKARLNDSGCTVIRDDVQGLRFIDVDNEWVYYTLVNGNSYKLKTNGSEHSLFCNDYAAFLTVYKDWIYYCNGSDNFRIYKLRPDGSEKTKLSDDSAMYLNIYDDNIYYIKVKDCPTTNEYAHTYSDYYGEIYKVQVDGNGRTSICNDASTHINFINNWIYYINASDNNKIYKIYVDGSKRKKIADYEVGTINIAGDLIYFNILKGDEVFKMHRDGRGHYLVSKRAYIRKINLVNNWIYGIKVAYDMPYRCKNDGTLNSLLVEKVKSAKHVRVAFEDGKSYVYRTIDKNIEVGSKVIVDGKKAGMVGEVTDVKVKYSHEQFAHYISEVVSYI